jgi:aspartate racemase
MTTSAASADNQSLMKTGAPTRPFFFLRNKLRPALLYDRRNLMKIAGMIGGLGPESTIDYYRLIITRYRARRPNAGYPTLIINSLDVDKGIAFLDAGQLSELADYLVAGVETLTRAGVEFGFMAANTPHIVFDEVERRSTLPLVSIVRATSSRVKALGMKKVGLFGTGFTMRATFFPDEFRCAGIALAIPTEAERAFIHDKYIHELLVGTFLSETRAEVLRIAERMKMEDGIEAIVLAGTELPLLLRESNPDVPLLDTAEIHVEAVVDELLR